MYDRRFMIWVMKIIDEKLKSMLKENDQVIAILQVVFELKTMAKILKSYFSNHES